MHTERAETDAAAESNGLRVRLVRLSQPVRARNFRLIWLAMVASETGDWVGRLALSLLVYERTGSPALTGAVTTVAVAPYLGLGQVVTARLSIRPARRVLIGCDLVRAAVYLCMVANPPIALLLALEFVNGTLTVPFESVRSAVLPSSVPEGQYGEALAVATITKEVALLLGYLAGGALFTVYGARWLLGLNAITFLVSATLLLGLPRPRRAIASQVRQQAPSVLRGARFVLGDPIIRRCVFGYAAVSGFAIVGDALAPVFVKEELGGDATQVGILLAAVSAAVIVFAVWAPRKGSETSLVRKGALIALLGAGSAALLFAINLSLPMAVLPFVALGAVFASRLPAYQVIGTRTPDSLRATVFGFTVGMISLTTVVVPVVAGALADRFSIVTVMWLFPALGAAVALLAAVLPLRDDGSGLSADVEQE